MNQGPFEDYEHGFLLSGDYLASRSEIWCHSVLENSLPFFSSEGHLSPTVPHRNSDYIDAGPSHSILFNNVSYFLPFSGAFRVIPSNLSSRLP